MRNNGRKNKKKPIRVTAIFITAYINRLIWFIKRMIFTLTSRRLRQRSCSRMHDVHDDHRKESEIVPGPPEPDYQDVVPTTRRKELEVILEPPRPIYRRPHSTYKTYLSSIGIQRYQSIRARTFYWPSEIEHQLDEFLRMLRDKWWTVTRIRFGE